MLRIQTKYDSLAIRAQVVVEGGGVVSNLLKETEYRTVTVTNWHNNHVSSGSVFVYIRVPQEKLPGLIQGWIDTPPPGVAPVKSKWDIDGPPESGPGASTLGN